MSARKKPRDDSAAFRASVLERLAKFEEKLNDRFGTALDLEQHRSQMYYERIQFLSQQVDNLMADKRRLLGEVERGTEALQRLAMSRKDA